MSRPPTPLRPDLASEAFKRNPFPAYARLREAGPVMLARVPFVGRAWLVSTHAAVNDVLKNHADFVQEPRHAGKRHLPGIRWWMPPTIRALTQNMLGRDEPDHRRLRGLVESAFHRQGLAELEGRIEAICDGLLDGLDGPGPVDLMARFARPFPLTVICELLGLPDEDRPRFSRWANSLSGAASGLGLVRALVGIGALSRYLRRHFAWRRREPGPGLISALIEAEREGEALSEEELLAMVFLLLIAGHETTVHLLAGGVLTLLEHPAERDRLRADPGLAAPAVEELLRHVSPVQLTKPRYARRDLALHGQPIARGDAVLPVLGAANSDPAAFEAPERLDLGRRPNPHLAFGAGIHACLGSQLARLEARIAFNKLLARFPDLRLAVPATDLRWTARFGLRALRALPVRVGPWPDM